MDAESGVKRKVFEILNNADYRGQSRKVEQQISGRNNVGIIGDIFIKINGSSSIPRAFFFCSSKKRYISNEQLRYLKRLVDEIYDVGSSLEDSFSRARIWTHLKKNACKVMPVHTRAGFS